MKQCPASCGSSRGHCGEVELLRRSKRTGAPRRWFMPEASIVSADENEAKAQLDCWGKERHGVGQDGPPGDACGFGATPWP